MKHGSLFSGIGGFDLAAHWMGWTNVFHTEWNEFGQKVLKHHFPQSISYHDIIKTDYTIHNGDIDIITGGFPCQPFSLAGKRKGTDDERYLWHEMLRAIQQIRPTYVVAENVRGLLTIDGGMVFEQVCADLEAEGYEVQPVLLPAAGVNAPHRRDRIFIVAYSKHNRHQAIRRKEEEENGISGINRSEMGARQSNRTDIRQAAANTNGTDKGSSNRRTDCKTEGNLWRNEKSNVSGTRDCTELAANTKDKRTGKLRNESSKEGTRFCDVVSGKSCGLSASTESAANTNITSATDEIQARRNVSASTRDTEPTSNTNSAGIQRFQIDTGASQSLGQGWQGSKETWDNGHFATWEEFPTQSAICGGNDGIPDRLDNITFPKWRNESIKAYGNAVVPQLILPIFQTIEKIHREKNT